MSARHYCPQCGRPDVIVGLDSVLREIRPEVRNHSCNVGGPGSASGETLEESVRAVLAGSGGTMGAVAEGLRLMGLGKS